MAVSRRVSSNATLIKFCDWAVRNGYKVGEHPKYGTVHRVHMNGSWHYESGAADINFAGGGERAKLIEAMRVAESLGLAVIFARDGIVGAAKNHQGHLHVDVGTQSNYGKGLVSVKRATTTNVPGVSTGVKYSAELARVQAALKHNYPAYAGHITVDGYDGPQTKAVVKEFQRRAGLVVDGIAGPVTRRKLGLA